MGRTRTKSKKSAPTSNGPSNSETPSIPSLLSKTQILIAQCNYDLAVQFARRIVERDPPNAEAREMLGVCLLETGEIDEAKGVCVTIPSIFGKNDETWNRYSHL